MADKRIATRFIRDANGNVVQSSANLSGVRRWITGIQVIGCPKRQIQKIAIDQFGHGEGKLSILFGEGYSFETNFASFAALAGFVRSWRNAYGAELLINGIPSGVVNLKNDALRAWTDSRYGLNGWCIDPREVQITR